MTRAAHFFSANSHKSWVAYGEPWWRKVEGWNRDLLCLSEERLCFQVLTNTPPYLLRRFSP